MADDTNTAERAGAYDMIDRFLRNNISSDEDYAEYSKALDLVLGASLAASAGSEPVTPAAPPMDGEIALIEKAVKRAGMTSLLNHGAASCVFTEGCDGVSQEHLLAYTREIALHCAVALGSPPEGMAGWISVDERLPEVVPNMSGCVETIAFWDDGAIETSWFWRGGKWQHADGEMDYHRESKVAHWMPLPAPPLPASEAKEL